MYSCTCRSFLNRDSVAAPPTFEDLIVDDKLSELDRVVRYAKSSIGLQRLVHVKMVASVAESFSFRDIEESLVPLFGTMATDLEPSIRRVFAAQLPAVARRCIAAGGEEGYRVVVDKVLPIVATLLEDDKAEIRQTASSSLAELSAMITNDDLGIYVLTIILALAHDDGNEEMRMTASVLFNLLADTLGQDLCKQFVIPEVVSLAEDPGFRVRKSIALNFQHICKVGGEHELFERLMPAFVRLSKDEMYRVRRACADSLASISEFVSDDIRIGVLVEIFLRLAQDPSKLVKQSILQQSGMFVASLPGRVVNSTILDLYCSLARSPLGDTQADDDLKKYCAYSFPGVLQAIGAARWGEVREVYHSLVQSQIPAVLHTLGLSLHVVARLLGERAVEAELVPVFEEMIQDSDEVRMGVIKYLADFLVLLSVPCRVSYLPLLSDLLQSANPLNWRLRQSLALQLSRLMDLLPAQNLFGTLFPLTMTLLQDPVFQVRRASYAGVVRMVMVLYLNLEAPLLPPPQAQAPPRAEDTASLALADLVKDKADTESGHCLSPSHSGAMYLAAVARAINALTFSESYQQRQAWAELSLRLLQEIPQHIFELYFVEGLIQLASDPVPNVRVAAAETLTGWEPRDYAPWDEPPPPPVGSPGAGDTPPPPAPASPSFLLSRSRSGEGGIGALIDVDTVAVEKRTDRPSPWRWLLARGDVHSLVQRLAQEDRDVFHSMRKLQPMFPLIEFEHKSCRGLRAAPGGPPSLDRRDRTFSMEERMLSQPAVTAVNIEHRGARALSDAQAGAQGALAEASKDGAALSPEGALAEGADEMAPWAEAEPPCVRENVDEEALEKMFDLPSPQAEERNRFYIPAGLGLGTSSNDDEDISPMQVAVTTASDASAAREEDGGAAIKVPPGDKPAADAPAPAPAVSSEAESPAESLPGEEQAPADVAAAVADAAVADADSC
jgi:serine/threonine-protein phosphatase 4 regulatory subunit 1